MRVFAFAAACVLACLTLVAQAQDCGTLDWSIEPGVTPAARTGAAMVYDSFRGRLVLFGGQTSTSISNATWEFDGTQWSQVTVTGTPPSPRYGHAMAYDSVRHVVVLFGGQTLTTVSAQTYEYDGSAWTLRSPTGAPNARQGHAMAFDSTRGRVVLFGGLTATGVSAATFEYDGQNWTNTGAAGPTARQGHVMAYDAARHVTVLHGGRTNNAIPETYDGSTWEWSGATWLHAQTDGMSARMGHCMAYDSVQHVMVAFGGVQGSSYSSQTWQYDGSAWTQLATSTSPSAKAGSCMAFDPLRLRTVVVGGTNGSTIYSDTWDLAGSGASAPIFSEHPSPANAALGDTVSFQAAASGSTVWHWTRDNVPVANGGHIAGATTPSLSIAGVTDADWGSYVAHAANSCGSTSSNPATLTQTSRCDTADFNCDGDVGTDSDIEAFFACLAGNCLPPPCFTNADFNGDGDVGTDSDIESFFRVLAGGPC